MTRSDDSSTSLVAGALVFRWVWLAWMVVLAVVGWEGVSRPALALVSLGIAGGWTLVLSRRPSAASRLVLGIDVVVCLWLVLASAFVVREGAVVSGRPFFATGYPLSAPLLWGAARGPAAGAVTAGILAVGHLLTRPLNGIALGDLTPGQVQNVTGAMLNYVVAGVAVGLVARLLWKSSDAVQRANEEVSRERERSARVAERDALARAIHDSVLQALALVNKRGKELARGAVVSPEEVARLADLAGKQEAELRALILRPPDGAPAGRASLRDALEGAAREIDGVPVNVSAVGPLWLPRRTVEELRAGVRQALENTVRHGRASKIVVFAEDDDGTVVVSVRDDGMGFDYQEAALEAGGKVGILKSMKGRVEDLGGLFRIATKPGEGTEVEFRVPGDRPA